MTKKIVGLSMISFAFGAAVTTHPEAISQWLYAGVILVVLTFL